MHNETSLGIYSPFRAPFKDFRLFSPKLLHEIRALFVNKSAENAPCARISTAPELQRLQKCRHVFTELFYWVILLLYLYSSGKKKKEHCSSKGNHVYYFDLLHFIYFISFIYLLYFIYSFIYLLHLGDACATTSRGRHILPAFLSIKTWLLRAVSPKYSLRSVTNNNSSDISSISRCPWMSVPVRQPRQENFAVLCL